MFPCLGFLVADPSCSYRAPLFSLASALLQRSCEQLQPYVGNGSTPCRPAFIFTHSRVFQTYEPPASGCTSYAHHRLADCPPVFPRSSTRRGFEPQTAAWSSSRWRELRASPTDSRHISYVQSHSIELNRSDLDFWPAHCGVTSHLWLHDSEQHAPGATWCVPLRRYTHPPHARMRLTGGKTECLTRTAFLSPRRADAASDRTTALSAIVALASSMED